MNLQTLEKLPPIPPALLDALDELYPEQSPRLGETHEKLMYRAGQRDVVRRLHEIRERQLNPNGRIARV